MWTEEEIEEVARLQRLWDYLAFLREDLNNNYNYYIARKNASRHSEPINQTPANTY